MYGQIKELLHVVILKIVYEYLNDLAHMTKKNMKKKLNKRSCLCRR